MSSSVIEEDEKGVEKGMLAVATDVKESSVATPSASKPYVYFQEYVGKYRFHLKECFTLMEKNKNKLKTLICHISNSTSKQHMHLPKWLKEW